MTAARAAIIEARRLARLAAMATLQRQGLKPAHIAAREIAAQAEVIFADRRAELIEEATQRVERWLTEVYPQRTPE
jgi:hypothetical protein